MVVLTDLLAVVKSQRHEFSANHLAIIALNWESTVEHLGDLLAVPSAQVPALHLGAFVEQIDGLRRRRAIEAERRAAEATAAEGRWVYMAAKCRGMLVGENVLSQLEGWRFNDHGNGTGVVYWWPAGDMHDAEAAVFAESEVVVLPVERRRSEASEGEPLVSEVALPASTRSIAEACDLPNSPPAAGDDGGERAADPIEAMREAYDRVERRLAVLGLRSVDVGGGGNCFFRALAAQHPECGYSAGLHRLARLRTARTMRANEVRFRDAVVLNEATPSYGSYVDRMSCDGSWVEGEVELLAAAAALNVNIHLWGESGAHDCRVLAPTPDMKTRNVMMVHFMDRHYRVLERISPEVSANKALD